MSASMTSLCEASCSGRGIAQRAALAPLLPRRGRRQALSRRQLAARALLQEADLPAALAALEHAAPQLQTLADSLALGLAGSAGAEEAGAALATQLGHLLALADAAVAAAPAAAEAGDAAAAASQQGGLGFLQPLVDALETVLSYLQDGLDKVHVPYSYGYSIILLTLIVKLVTFPLTKQQVESSLAVQQLKPQIDLIKAKYGEDKEAISREQNALYEKAGVNPLAGCLPTLAAIPIFIGLYRSLSDSAASGVFDNQGFYWIPSLAGPTTLAAQKAGAGISWLWPLVDGHPPIGWEAAGAYCVLPVLVVVGQWISSAIITPPIDPKDPNANTQKAIIYLLPLMVGWFSLNVPSGLALYYFSNTVFTTGIQIWLRKLGGANINLKDLGPIELGKARRTGTVAGSVDDDAATAAAAAAAGAAAGAAVGGNGAPGLAYAAAPMDASASDLEGPKNGAEAMAAPVPTISRRCKRKKRELLAA